MMLRTMLGALLLAGATAAAAGPSADERQLTALLHDFLAGASRAEAAAHERFWDEDLVYTSSAGERFGKAEILDGLRAAAESPDATDAAAATTTYRAEDIRVRVYGDAAVVAFRLVGEDAAGGVMQYFNTGTFLRRAGEWRAVAWQATRIGDG